jgi:hypothetical protein
MVPQVSKSNAQSNTVVALDNLKVVSGEIRFKFDALRPLQDREKAQREEVSLLPWAVLGKPHSYFAVVSTGGSTPTPLQVNSGIQFTRKRLTCVT